MVMATMLETEMGVKAAVITLIKGHFWSSIMFIFNQDRDMGTRFSNFESRVGMVHFVVVSPSRQRAPRPRQPLPPPPDACLDAYLVPGPQNAVERRAKQKRLEEQKKIWAENMIIRNVTQFAGDDP
ncbi:hypothetical protein LXL04_024452 [Taraxacum kok-saghyz]